MDFSKLPQMSKTPDMKNDPEPPPVPGHHQQQYRPPPLDYAPPPMAGIGPASVFVSFIAGLLCLMFGANFGRFLSAKLSGKTFDTGVEWTAGPNAGTQVAYFELQGGTAWMDMGLFLMGVALLIDALVMLLYYRGKQPSPKLVMLAIGITGIALLINVVLGFYLFTLGVMPVVSLIVIFVGGMVLFDHVPLIKHIEQQRRAESLEA